MVCYTTDIIIHTNPTTTVFTEDKLYGIFHKAQNHLPREKGGVGWWGLWCVVVHTKAFPVRKIYGTKSPLSKRQL
jgi:hypothetical protein